VTIEDIVIIWKATHPSFTT